MLSHELYPEFCLAIVVARAVADVALVVVRRYRIGDPALELVAVADVCKGILDDLLHRGDVVAELPCRVLQGLDVSPVEADFGFVGRPCQSTTPLPRLPRDVVLEVLGRGQHAESVRRGVTVNPPIVAIIHHDAVDDDQLADFVGQGVRLRLPVDVYGLSLREHLDLGGLH